MISYTAKWTNTNKTSCLWSIIWKQELNLQSFNLFFSTKAQAISYATFKRHCTYPEDLNLDLEVMWNQIRVKQEYSKKYTTSENHEARYSMPKCIRTMKDCVMRILVVMLNFQRRMVEMVCIHDSIDDKPIIMRTIMIEFTLHT